MWCVGVVSDTCHPALASGTWNRNSDRRLRCEENTWHPLVLCCSSVQDEQPEGSGVGSGPEGSSSALPPVVRRSSSNPVGTAGPRHFYHLRGSEAVLYRHFLRLLLSSLDPSTLITNRGSLFISISLSRNITNSCNHVISVCHPCVSKRLIFQEAVMKTFIVLRQKGKAESLQPSPPVSPGGDLSEMSSPWRKKIKLTSSFTTSSTVSPVYRAFWFPLCCFSHKCSLHSDNCCSALRCSC